MDPADKGRVIDITEVEVLGVQEVMGLIHTETEGRSDKKPDGGKKSDEKKNFSMRSDHRSPCRDDIKLKG
jgi:hypothetical protein